MSHKKAILIIILCVALSLLANAMFGGSLAAKLSTVRLFNRFQLVKPAAPIVINRTEEIRANDSEDITNAIDKAKSKVSLLVYKSDNSIKVAGGLINIASDGLFLTSKAAIAAAGTNSLFVLTNDGKTFPVEASFGDPATNLVMLKTNATGVSVADFGRSEELAAGQRIAFLSASSAVYATRFTASFVSFPMADVAGQIFDSDRPSNSFGVQGVSGIFAGQAVINLSGEIVGIFDGVSVISSTVVRSTVSSFIEKKAALSRPAYGFKYRVLGQAESTMLGLPLGAQLVKPAANQPAVVPNSAAAAAGLIEGDIITQVGDIKVDLTNTLEALLQKYKPGEAVTLSITRSGRVLNIIIRPGLL